MGGHTLLGELVLGLAEESACTDIEISHCRKQGLGAGGTAEKEVGR